LRFTAIYNDTSRIIIWVGDAGREMMMMMMAGEMMMMMMMAGEMMMMMMMAGEMMMMMMMMAGRWWWWWWWWWWPGDDDNDDDDDDGREMHIISISAQAMAQAWLLQRLWADHTGAGSYSRMEGHRLGLCLSHTPNREWKGIA
jgi:hypothetical protein